MLTEGLPFTLEERALLSPVGSALLAHADELLWGCEDELGRLDWGGLSPESRKELIQACSDGLVGLLESLRDGCTDRFAREFSAGKLRHLLEKGIGFQQLSLSSSIVHAILYRRLADLYCGEPRFAVAMSILVKVCESTQAILAGTIIAERDRALADLQGTVNLLRSIIDTTPDWIFLKDRDHRYRMVNQSYARAFHMSPQQFVGKNNVEIGFPEELVMGDPTRGIRGIWPDDQQVMESGETLSIPYDLVSIDGVLHVFDTIKIPLRDGDGQVWGLLGFARDMTELKVAEEELRKYRDRLADLVEKRTSELTVANQQLQREVAERRRMEQYVLRTERLAAMGRLAAALAHEINNPLQGIGSSLDLVLDYPLGAEERLEYLEPLRHEIVRLGDLARRMLDFARPPQVDRHPISLPGVVRHALALAMKQLHQRGIVVEADLPSELPLVLASADYLSQVFLNLIINAIDAMPDGGRLRIVAGEVEGGVEVAFADSGPGIAPEALATIFEPFYTTKENGSGLGLSISHGIILQHNGAITARNDPDGGAVFTIRIPIAPTETQET